MIEEIEPIRAGWERFCFETMGGDSYWAALAFWPWFIALIVLLIVETAEQVIEVGYGRLAD